MGAGADHLYDGVDEAGCNAMFVDDLSVTVPEPGLISLIGLALGGAVGLLRKR